MQSDNRIFADIMRVLNGAAGTFAGMGREAGESAKEHAREWMSGADFVSREEFDAVKAMASKAREQAEALRARVDALEKAGGSGRARPAKKAAPRKRPAARKPKE